MEVYGDLGKSCFGGMAGTKISLDWLQKMGEERSSFTAILISRERRQLLKGYV